MPKLKRGKKFPTKPTLNTQVKNWKDNMKVIIEVVKSPYRNGYSLRHNMEVGWKGTTSNVFGWYKYKSDAEQSAREMNETYNK